MVSSEDTGPRLSVAVASAGEPDLLEACLDSIEAARARVDLPVAVFVARPASAANVSELFHDRPWASLLTVGGDPDIPQLRGVAMRAAGEGWIAVTEDLFLADPEWLASMWRHATPDTDVLGGAVGNARTDVVSHAAYLTDYGSFPPDRPAERGVKALTGANVMYGPEVSDRAGRWASAGAWEHVVHGRLSEKGASLRFEPSARVEHNATYGLRELLAVRFRHGLQYARDRLEEDGGGSRLVRVLLAPLFPPLLVVRLARVSARPNTMRFLRAAPMVLALYTAWIAGESLGYLTGSKPKD